MVVVVIFHASERYFGSTRRALCRCGALSTTARHIPAVLSFSPRLRRTTAALLWLFVVASHGSALLFFFLLSQDCVAQHVPLYRVLLLPCRCSRSMQAYQIDVLYRGGMYPTPFFKKRSSRGRRSGQTVRETRTNLASKRLLVLQISFSLHVNQRQSIFQLMLSGILSFAEFSIARSEGKGASVFYFMMLCVFAFFF